MSPSRSSLPCGHDRTQVYLVLTVATVGLTIALMVMGAVVRATGSGLGCPDWPLCHGGLLPLNDRAAAIEWSHRSLAAFTGLIILIEVVLTVLQRPRRSVMAAALGVPVVLGIQVGLGREAVRRELPPEVVAIHLVTALVLLGLLVWIAVASVERERGTRWYPRGIFGLNVATVGVLATVMVLGAYMVANSAGLACSDWPGCSEGPVPFLDGDRAQAVHWLHRLAVAAGLMVIGAQALASIRRRESTTVRGAAIALLLLYSTQVLVGGANIWFQLPTSVRVLHVLLSSLLWSLAMAITLFAVVGRFLDDDRSRVSASSVAEVSHA